MPPGGLPAEWDVWDAAARAIFQRKGDPHEWRLLIQGVVAGNGFGDAISEEEAEEMRAWASRTPLQLEEVRAAGFFDDLGFCLECGVPYCSKHWSPSSTGFGTCPKGHGKTLDPHWSPEV